MDDFLQKSTDPVILFVVLPGVALLSLYIITRLAVTLGLRDHERWLEKRRINASRRRYPDQQFYRPISPEPEESA